MKLVFMGTPEFAAGALEALLQAGHEVVCVVTQPDRPKGRSGEPQFSPVKECALKYGIEVFQPVKIKEEEAVKRLKSYPAEAYVVAAFGQILSREILKLPPYGCFNIHASLLPKYRGAAPIQRAIIDGETVSGVTIMKMDEGLDTGDMLARAEVVIAPEDTADTLHDKLSAAGARLIVETLPLIEQGRLTPEKQDDSRSTYAKMLTKEMGRIDWTRPAEETERLVRGLNSWPSAYTGINGKMLKIWRADVKNDTPGYEAAEPGIVTAVEKDSFTVKTGSGSLRILEVQLAGKKKMTAGAFLAGAKLAPGERLQTIG